MFRITQDPSSGSDNVYVTEITYNDSVVLIMCVVGVWRHIVDLWYVCVCVCRLRRTEYYVTYTHPHTHTHTHTHRVHHQGVTTCKKVITRPPTSNILGTTYHKL